MEDRDNTHTSLNAAEYSDLWAAYLDASMGQHIVTTFLQHVEDEPTKQLLIEIKDELKEGVNQLASFFQQASHPVPFAFTNQDINLEAPRLYTDDFFLLYATQIGAFGMFAHTQATVMSMREDVRAFFSERSRVFDAINDKAVTLALEKGIFPEPPTVPIVKEVDFIQRNSFMRGFFGEKRPLTALEISNLHINLQRNNFGIQTLLGFSQVARSEDVRQYISKGIAIAQKHMKQFKTFLEAEKVPSPGGSRSMVTDEHQMSPYSDKLMTFLVTQLILVSVTFYGMALTTTARHDLSAQYMKSTAEILKYAQEGAKLLIDKGWMEEPPRMIDRDELINKKED